MSGGRFKVLRWKTMLKELTSWSGWLYELLLYLQQSLDRQWPSSEECLVVGPGWAVALQLPSPTKMLFLL